MFAAKFAAAVITLVEKNHFHRRRSTSTTAAQTSADMPLENTKAASPPSSAASFRSTTRSLGFPLSAVFLARLFLLDEIDHRLRVGERIGRSNKNRIRNRVASFLPGFTGMHRHG